MTREELEHLIRAAAEVTGEYEFVVVGSQSILGPIPDPPAELTMSMEADIYPMNAEEKADAIDGALGEGSHFHETYGYYAQGVDSTTACLPQGWKGRLQRVQSPATNGRVGYCLDVIDLFMAKTAANREGPRVQYCVDAPRIRVAPGSNRHGRSHAWGRRKKEGDACTNPAVDEDSGRARLPIARLRR